MADVYVVGASGPDDPAYAMAQAAAAAVDAAIADHPWPCRACGAWVAAGERVADHRCGGAR